tara:strand:+ start:478 stop:651 length:174 start_codon:yes stop_codon:yes gene_type:complete
MFSMQGLFITFMFGVLVGMTVFTIMYMFNEIKNNRAKEDTRARLSEEFMRDFFRDKE